MEPGAGEPEVEIRTAPHVWIPQLVLGGMMLTLAILQLLLGNNLLAVFMVVVGCASLCTGLWGRTMGVDLTPECADVRGLRRSRLAWRDVQAVVRHQRQGAWEVRLILEGGQTEKLRAPTTLWDVGAARYERDFHRIGRWWLAHRGESWRPVLPEAPQPGAQRW
jgi:hypothetical protein